MRTIVTWLWQGKSGWGRKYKPEHADLLQHQLSQHMSTPFELVCITDFPADQFGERIRVMPIPREVHRIDHLTNPSGERFPTCYRRLWLFSGSAYSKVAKRFMCVDVDVAVVDDWEPLFQYKGDFVGWNPIHKWG